MRLKDYGVAGVCVRYKAYDFSMCHNKPQEGIISLTADDEARLWVPCPNTECTSRGFPLIDVLKESIQKKQRRATGRLFCTGKESRKPGSLSCANWLDYDMTIEY